MCVWGGGGVEGERMEEKKCETEKIKQLTVCLRKGSERQ